MGFNRCLRFYCIHAGQKTMFHFKLLFMRPFESFSRTELIYPFTTDIKLCFFLFSTDKCENASFTTSDRISVTTIHAQRPSHLGLKRAAQATEKYDITNNVGLKFQIVRTLSKPFF